MKSTTSVVLNLQLPNYSVSAYAVQGDEKSRQIEAALFDGQTAFVPPAGALGTIRYHKPDGTAGFYDTLEDETTVAVTWDGNIATIRFAAQVLTVAGEVIVQLSFYSADAERLSAFNFILHVEKNPLTDAQFESTDYYSVLTARIADVLGAVAHAPQINSSGHWVLWDEENQEYYDSGVNATGPQGDIGPRGYAIGSTYLKSGTGAAGTTDVYGMKLNDPDETEVGTFNVYNGQDGMGAPSSTIPAMDGTASAGSENGYSRGDHVHPKDTSKLNVTDGVTAVTYESGVLKQTVNGTKTDVFSSDATPTQNSDNPIKSGTVYKMFYDVIEVTLEDVGVDNLSFSVTGVTAAHELVQKGYAYLSNPDALGSDVTITTSSGTITLSGTFNDVTDIVMTLGIKNVKVTGT